MTVLSRKSCFFIALSTGASILVGRWFLRAQRRRRLRRLVERRRAELGGEKAAAGALLDRHTERGLRDRVLAMRFEELLRELAEERLRPVEALCAFLGRALEADEATNCLTGILLAAEERALQLELKFKGQDKPPLFGLPVSVKENQGLAGETLTAGYAQFLQQRSPGNSGSVETMLALGAVPFVRTNVPQSLFVFASSNPIYGVTTNPHNNQRSCGGSSGGEGALMGAGGSPLGLGGDIAGSIRLPAHWNGIAGLRPTMRRFAMRGNRGVSPGIAVVGNSSGPMAQEVDALTAYLRAVYAPDSVLYRDPYVVRMPFDEEELGSSRPLRIGFYEDDGWFPATPACRRAVRVAADSLRAKGHILVPFAPPAVGLSFRLLVSICLPDGGAFVRGLVDGDLEEASSRWLWSALRLPAWARGPLALWLRMTGDHRRAAFVGALPRSSSDVRRAHAETAEFRQAFGEAWAAAGLDALLCPPAATPAMPHDDVMSVFPMFTYTSLFNVLDYPGGVVRVTAVTDQDEADMAGYPRREPCERLVAAACGEGTVGLPLGAQVVAQPYREERVLRLLKELEG